MLLAHKQTDLFEFISAQEQQIHFFYLFTLLYLLNNSVVDA